ncbi:MAG: hypothetical protein EZS26_002281 [Candidatus Ordinivivax streblomastigis]|uniref:Fibrobacter succinogenes major paralogous domain-containing protein n=1 Tax=Candidatus Ordinivivax streblomastigis TaxID=2540710 RepID=A0A5M8NZE5_9BACT|nr:MAG: hypothetical protein EZS26_002281 [Candidatus Ordinivivax streblomastigis]
MKRKVFSVMTFIILSVASVCSQVRINGLNYVINGSLGIGPSATISTQSDGLQAGKTIPPGMYQNDGSTWVKVDSVESTDDIVTADQAEDSLGTVTDVDGNSYRIFQFGNAGCWMTENLKTTHYADSTELKLNNKSKSKAKAKSYAYPNNSAANKEAYGLLYTWPAASGRITNALIPEANSSTQDQYQGICPIGWHLPSDYEWNVLENELANNPTLSDEFKTPFAGCSGDNIMQNYGARAYFWSSSFYTTNAICYWYLTSNSKDLHHYYNKKQYLYSIRCKKD